MCQTARRSDTTAARDLVAEHGRASRYGVFGSKHDGNACREMPRLFKMYITDVGTSKLSICALMHVPGGDQPDLALNRSKQLSNRFIRDTNRFGSAVMYAPPREHAELESEY